MKHPYLGDAFYNQVLLKQQISFFKELLIESGQNHDPEFFYALLHMQLSLDIHDLVDLEFNLNSAHNRNQTNQLQVLVGDYHSSYFYRILSEHNLLDELYHLIQSIKSINEVKMSLLHNTTDDLNEQLQQIEAVHCGLYNSLMDYYKLDDYKEKNYSKLVNQLVYERESIWLDLLAKRDSAAKNVIDKRKNELYRRA
ncbi:heptaprenyl diphosphate synthase component 1 [Piscibacillus salipiscarius]|uniref:heptaprenyl diphosphate synthase component 1 n=1 Tax=Piscibacillus salipiscarius TaxID=299480 RepID=UPI0024371924|nr:heptaprenyl diphosphate synthase component 1 [Piscibacillus salipiscarius]